jgi:hypothetical protein
MNLRDSEREVMVDGVVRRLSDQILVAPPIPREFDMLGSFHSTFGYRIEDFRKEDSFVEGGAALWRHWSYPFMLGPFAIGEGSFDAIVTAPIRGLYLRRSYNGLGSLEEFDSRKGEVGWSCGFTMILFDGDDFSADGANIYSHLINSVERHFDEFQPKKLRGTKPSNLEYILERFRESKPWIGDVDSSPFGHSQYAIREAILRAHSETMRQRR